MKKILFAVAMLVYSLMPAKADPLPDDDARPRIRSHH